MNMKVCSNRSAIVVFLLVGMSLFLFGCGGGGSASTPPAAPQAISGKVNLNGAGLAGVSVALGGAAAGISTTTNSTGGYGFSGVSNGTYTITPSIAGFTFFPASQTINVANGNYTVPDFTATAVSTSFTVSGRVTLNGAPQSGVTVTIAGAGTGSTTTLADGSYSFSSVSNGNCTITPSAAGFTYSPLSQAITVANADATVPDFTATTAIASTFTVSGTVSLNGTGLAGVAVTISGAGSGVVITGDGGSYSFIGVRNGSYTLTPSLAGNTFAPASSSFSVSNANVTGQDFAATPDGTGTVIITF